MARLESETKRYVTWLPFLIDSARWTRRGWHISKQERMTPKSKLLTPFSLVFPVLRVTYERIVPGGIWHPEEYRKHKQLAAEMLSRDPSLAKDPSLAAWFISVGAFEPEFASERERPIPLVPPEPPLPPDSSTPEVDPPLGGPFPLPSGPKDGGVQETQQEGASASSVLPPPPPPAPQRPREGI